MRNVHSKNDLIFALTIKGKISLFITTICDQVKCLCPSDGTAHFTLWSKCSQAPRSSLKTTRWSRLMCLGSRHYPLKACLSTVWHIPLFFDISLTSSMTRTHSLIESSFSQSSILATATTSQDSSRRLKRIGAWPPSKPSKTWSRFAQSWWTSSSHTVEIAADLLLREARMQGPWPFSKKAPKSGQGNNSTKAWLLTKTGRRKPRSSRSESDAMGYDS